MTHPIYLDYAATTPMAPEVALAIAQCLTLEGDFANPASLQHSLGALELSMRGANSATIWFQS